MNNRIYLVPVQSLGYVVVIAEPGGNRAMAVIGKDHCCAGERIGEEEHYDKLLDRLPWIRIIKHPTQTEVVRTSILNMDHIQGDVYAQLGNEVAKLLPTLCEEVPLPLYRYPEDGLKHKQALNVISLIDGGKQSDLAMLCRWENGELKRSGVYRDIEAVAAMEEMAKLTGVPIHRRRVEQRAARKFADNLLMAARPGLPVDGEDEEVARQLTKKYSHENPVWVYGNYNNGSTFAGQAHFMLSLSKKKRAIMTLKPSDHITSPSTEYMAEDTEFRLDDPNLTLYLAE